MQVLLAVAAGGALGSLARYGVSHGLRLWLGPAFPYGTLAVNALGGLAAGALYAALLARAGAAEWRALLLTGFLGGFTTFSAFALETVVLAGEGLAGRAALNVLLNVALSLGACALGFVLARPLLAA